MTQTHTDQQLAADARHTSKGLRSAEDEALESLRDNNIEAASAARAVGIAVYYADVMTSACPDGCWPIREASGWPAP